MALGDIPSKMYFKTIDTAETPLLGTFQLADDMQLRYARLFIFAKGAITTEQLTLKILSTNYSNTTIATSVVVSLSAISNPSTNWIGWILFTFSGEFLDASSTYNARLETTSYTRNADTTYLSVALDWPLPINTSAVLSDPAIGIELYGTL